MHKNALIMALILPILIPIGLIIYHTCTMAGTVWHIPIRGFDPRDLLRGRYIEFQYDTNALPRIEDGMVLCLNDTPDEPTFTSAYKINVGDCGAWIDPMAANLNGAHRFYLPEAIADKADSLFRDNDNNFHALVTIRNGRMQLQSLSVNDIDIHISADQDVHAHEP